MKNATKDKDRYPSIFETANLGVLRDSATARTNAEKRMKELKRAADLAAYQERMRPLSERLKDLLAKMPNEIKNAGLPIAALQERLKGRFKGNANITELAKALRALGYVRHRQWSNSEGFCARWYPDGMQPKKRSKTQNSF
jgi:hypothetical protein